MTAKMFEIRDDGTCIPILAVRLDPTNESERWLLSRAGFGSSAEDQCKYVQLCQISGGEGRTACDPYDWVSRTYGVAHKYIIENFETLTSGDVVDVEFILGETPSSKVRHDTN